MSEEHKLPPELPKISRRRFIRVMLGTAAGLLAGNFIGCTNNGRAVTVLTQEDLLKFDWGFIVDTTRCIGCGSCVRACSVENKVPDGYFRTWVERYEIGEDGEVHVDSPNGAKDGFVRNLLTAGERGKSFFVPKLCNHCENSACTQVCPVGATFQSPDGVVLIDREHCVGCGYCVQACPYGTRYIDHRIGTADKCTFCYHRLHKGLTSACVEACPRSARVIGNLKDPHSAIRRMLRERRFTVLKPEMGTKPKCFYIGLDMKVV